MNLYRKYLKVCNKPDNRWPVGHKTYFSVNLPDNHTLIWVDDFVPKRRIRLYYFHNQQLIQKEIKNVK